MILQGLDIMEKDGFTKFKNKKVGLVINYSFVNKNMEDGIEIMLKNGVDIRKIFTPEHGLYGLADGVEYPDQIHPVYNIPIISLYGKHKQPTQEMLEDIDVLVYDIQDEGEAFENTKLKRIKKFSLRTMTLI